MSSRLNIFRVSIPDSPSGVAFAPYANDRQQITLVVEVLKIDSDNKPQNLTPAEAKSLTILPYSNELFPKQAAGWNSDEAYNGYVQGIWRRPGFAAAENDEESVELLPSVEAVDDGNDASQTFYRYMRYGGSEIRPFEFMACVTIDGQKYSTHFDNGDQRFESKVTLTPVKAYRLGLDDLNLTRDEAYNKEYAKNKRLLVEVYYWRLPSGVSIQNESFTNMGALSPVLSYVYAKNESALFIGAVIRNGTTNLTLGDIIISAGTGDAKLPEEIKSDTKVSLVLNDKSAMRALRYACNGSESKKPYERTVTWAIVDCYGCESRFSLQANPVDKGNTLKLMSA